MAARRGALMPWARQHSLTLGVAFTVAGSVLLWDAYERRGKGRPFALRFLPGP